MSSASDHDAAVLLARFNNNEKCCDIFELIHRLPAIGIAGIDTLELQQL